MGHHRRHYGRCGDLFPWRQSVATLLALVAVVLLAACAERLSPYVAADRSDCVRLLAGIWDGEVRDVHYRETPTTPSLFKRLVLTKNGDDLQAAYANRGQSLARVDVSVTHSAGECRITFTPGLTRLNLVLKKEGWLSGSLWTPGGSRTTEELISSRSTRREPSETRVS